MHALLLKNMTVGLVNAFDKGNYGVEIPAVNALFILSRDVDE
jgi:hypothetical protein